VEEAGRRKKKGKGTESSGAKSEFGNSKNTLLRIWEGSNRPTMIEGPGERPCAIEDLARRRKGNPVSGA